MTQVSVILVTRDIRFLRETLQTVAAQTMPADEIVLVPYGSVRRGDLGTLDARVRILPYEGPPRIGAIKHFAFGAAEGDVLVLVSAGDLIARAAVAELVAALREAEADFAYGNFADFRNETGEPIPCDSLWGWDSRPVQLLQRKALEIVAFDASPASIAHAAFIPRGIMAWTREGYRRSGEYDASTSVAEDQELLIRTFLTGKMTRVDKCLTLRRHEQVPIDPAGDDERRQKNRELYARWIDPLVLRWAALIGLPCLDLSCVDDRLPGFVAVEINGQTALASLGDPWPWERSSVAAFRGYELLEYLPDKIHSMAELHRCLVPGGWFLSRTASATGQAAHMDPRQASTWVRNSFMYWTDRTFARKIGNQSVRFQVQRLSEDYPTPWHRIENIPYVYFDAVCLKDGYIGPGPQTI